MDHPFTPKYERDSQIESKPAQTPKAQTSEAQTSGVKTPSVRRFGRGLAYGFICMIMGALFYSANTETLDNCRALYDSLSVKVGDL